MRDKTKGYNPIMGYSTLSLASVEKIGISSIVLLSSMFRQIGTERKKSWSHHSTAKIVKMETKS